MNRMVTILGVEMTVRDLAEDLVGIGCIFLAVYIILLLGAGFQPGWIA